MNEKITEIYLTEIASNIISWEDIADHVAHIFPIKSKNDVAYSPYGDGAHIRTKYCSLFIREHMPILVVMGYNQQQQDAYNTFFSNIDNILKSDVVTDENGKSIMFSIVSNIDATDELYKHLNTLVASIQ